MSVKFLPDMDIAIKTSLGTLHISFILSAFQGNISRTATITAPFLLVPLKVGNRGFSSLSKILNRIISTDIDSALAEFLDRAAISGAASHWLKEGIGALNRLRKRQEKTGTEKYREIAWSLKTRNFAICENKLLVLGDGDIHVIDFGQTKTWCIYISQDGYLYPAIIKKALEEHPASTSKMWLNDDVFKRNLRHALESSGEDVTAEVVRVILSEGERV